MRKRKGDYHLYVFVTVRIVSKNDSDHLAALLIASEFASAHGDSLCEVKLQLSFLSPIKLLLVVTN